MTTDYRSNLIRTWGAFLEARPSNNNVLAVAVPLGDLADIAIDALTEGEGVPRVPRYNKALFGQMKWTEPLDMERAQAGDGFTTIAVDCADQDSDTTHGARFVLTDALGNEHVICLSPAIAEQFALATLAVARETASVALNERA